MGFLLRHPKLYVLATVGLLASALISFILMILFLCSFGGCGDKSVGDTPQIIISLAEILIWLSIFLPVPIFFRIILHKVGLKDTIKLFTLYFVIGFLFTIGQLVGMEKAWVVLLLMLIILPTMTYLLNRYS